MNASSFGVASPLGGLVSIPTQRHAEPEDHPEFHPWRWEIDVTAENQQLLRDYLADVEDAAELDLCAVADRAVLLALVRGFK